MTTNFFFTPFFSWCFWIRDPGSGIRDKHPGSATLIRDSDLYLSRTSDPGSRISDPGSRIPDPGSQISDPGSKNSNKRGGENLLLQISQMEII
jgi:hypothetical protein